MIALTVDRSFSNQGRKELIMSTVDFLKPLSMVAVIIVTVCMVSAICADAPAAGLRAGLKGGLCWANVVGKDSAEMSNKMGFCGGGFMVIPINQPLSFQAELLYVMKGGREREELYPDDTVIKLSLNYIEIPLLAKWSFIPIGAFRFNAICGPVVCFNLDAKGEWEHQGDSGEDDLDKDVKDTDFGLTVGGEFETVLGWGRLIIDARYTVGLTSFDRSDYDLDDVRNSVIL